MNYLNFTARVFFSLMFLISGFSHFSAQTIAYAASTGLPFANLLVPASGLLAIAGAVSIITGYKAKIGALLIVLFLVPITLTMHQFWKETDPMLYQMQFINFMKNVSILGGALLVVAPKVGSFSTIIKSNRFKATELA
ncbi:DoxX family protein [Desertivirga xinjiangensis]|uniref:DoxX family protein n=1 Tax=Desertivirga xinjiangensis TaxID=539206 RepID=UPI00210A7794|nr:DoxX family protein [Pedobacter xinjiangensis]